MPPSNDKGLSYKASCLVSRHLVSICLKNFQALNTLHVITCTIKTEDLIHMPSKKEQISVISLQMRNMIFHTPGLQKQQWKRLFTKSQNPLPSIFNFISQTLLHFKLRFTFSQESSYPLSQYKTHFIAGQKSVFLYDDFNYIPEEGSTYWRRFSIFMP